MYVQHVAGLALALGLDFLSPVEQQTSRLSSSMPCCGWWVNSASAPQPMTRRAMLATWLQVEMPASQGVNDRLRVHALTLAEARLAALENWIGLWSSGDVGGAAQRGRREQPAFAMHAAND